MKTYRDKHGLVKLIFNTKGELHSVEIASKTDLVDWEGIRHSIPFITEHITDQFEEVKTNTVNEKIALFCIGYRAWSKKTTGTELEYKPTKAEAGQLKTIKLTEDLLRTFLLNDFWTKEKTISNYVKHYNEIQRITAQKSTGTVPTSSDTLEDAFLRRYSTQNPDQ